MWAIGKKNGDKEVLIDIVSSIEKANEMFNELKGNDPETIYIIEQITFPYLYPIIKTYKGI